MAPINPWRADPRFQPIFEIAKTFYAEMHGYREMTESGYSAIFGPLVDVAPRNKRSLMWELGRIHTDRPRIASFFARLAIASAKVENKTPFCFIKHAPGIGSIQTTSFERRNDFVLDTRSEAEISASFQAFEAVVDQMENGVGVMVAGVVVPTLGIDRFGTDSIAPAALSPSAIAWMRERLGEDILFMTDDAASIPFWNYLGGYYTGKPGDYIAEKGAILGTLLKQSVAADIDLILYFEGDYPDRVLGRFLEEGRNLIKKGEVTRAELEKSVRRILAAKRNQFPSDARLRDIDATIAGMTNDQLWAQKLFLGVYVYNDQKLHFLESVREAVQMGVGGLSMEGYNEHLEEVKLILADSEGPLPIFLGENSPQELPGYDNRPNVERLRIWEQIRTFSTTYDTHFPKGAPDSFFDSLWQRVIESHLDNL